NLGGATTSAAVPITVNTAPTVSITSPSDGAVFPAPATITVSASASDPDGSVAKVDFYQGATLIGTASAAPYSATTASLGSGTYSFTAVATDNSGATTTSAAVSVRANAAPTVTITAPTTGATFNAPASITISATALDPDGTIVSVAFYQNGTLITTVTAAPYNITWTGVPQGSYSLTAVATDDGGATATSDAVVVTVGAHVAQMYFVHPDHLNTPRVVSDATGTTVWRWDQTDPFGGNSPDQNPRRGVAREDAKSGPRDDPGDRGLNSERRMRARAANRPSVSMTTVAATPALSPPPSPPSPTSPSPTR